MYTAIAEPRFFFSYQWESVSVGSPQAERRDTCRIEIKDKKCLVDKFSFQLSASSTFAFFTCILQMYVGNNVGNLI